jgi:hypothetical protein
MRITGEVIKSPITKSRYWGLVPVMRTIELSNIEKIEIKKKYKNSDWIASIEIKVGRDLDIYQNAVNDWKKFVRVLSEDFDGIVDVVVIVPTFKSYDHINYQNQRTLYEEVSLRKKIVVNTTKYLGVPFLIIFLLVTWGFVLYILFDIFQSVIEHGFNIYILEIIDDIFGLILYSILLVVFLGYMKNTQLPKITDFGVYPSMPLVKKYKFIPHDDVRKAIYYNNRIEFKVIYPKKLFRISEVKPVIAKKHCSDFKKIKKILRDLDRYDID